MRVLGALPLLLLPLMSHNACRGSVPLLIYTRLRCQSSHFLLTLRCSISESSSNFNSREAKFQSTCCCWLRVRSLEVFLSHFRSSKSRETSLRSTPPIVKSKPSRLESLILLDQEMLTMRFCTSGRPEFKYWDGVALNAVFSEEQKLLCPPTIACLTSIHRSGTSWPWTILNL